MVSAALVRECWAAFVDLEGQHCLIAMAYSPHYFKKTVTTGIGSQRIDDISSEKVIASRKKVLRVPNSSTTPNPG
jgi:hypothetical protein